MIICADIQKVPMRHQFQINLTWANNFPQPNAISTINSAVAVHVTSQR